MASQSEKVAADISKLSLENAAPPKLVTDLVAELIDYATNESYLTPTDLLVSENKSKLRTEKNENPSIPLPISKEMDVFYICHRFDEFFRWTDRFRSSERRLDIVQFTYYIPGLSVKKDISFKSGVRLQQIKVLKQHVGGYCGHHAFFNGLTLLSAVSARDPQLALTWLFLTGQRLAYWKRYWDTIRILSSYAVLIGEHWPWVVKDIERGGVERTYMSYLLTSDPTLLQLNGKVHVLQFGFGSIQSPKSDLFQLHSSFQALRTQQCTSLAILLGVTNHWLAAVVYSVTPAEESWTKQALSGESETDSSENCSRSDGCALRVVFMDSNNAPVIEASEELLEAYCAKHVAQYEKKKKEKMSDWKRETFRQALEDERELMRIVVACTSGESLLYLSLRSNVHRMLLNFYANVDAACEMRRQDYVPTVPLPWFLRNKNFSNSANTENLKYAENGLDTPADLDKYLAKLVSWLEEWYRPKQIHENICRDMKAFSIQKLEEDLSYCLTHWCSHLLTVLTSMTQINLPIVLELVEVLTDISDTLSA